ncbi:hypothetical protein PAL_GLEAN10009279 [Pteropus alecto]|uniref:Uncharacterized protein n=1 Tax=Pteropus alecto TaxID=9402 RepID=L5KVE3_PTEAL|nr:hypothetical protein PAL_GLEAN10009279 [Pteropus alecto]
MWPEYVLLQQDKKSFLRKLSVEPTDAILTPHDTRRLRFHDAPANLKGQTSPSTCQAEETEAPGGKRGWDSVCKWQRHLQAFGP